MDFARVNLLLVIVVIIGLNADIASAQVLGKNCSVDANCTGVANTTCSSSHICACIASFKVSSTTCVPKVIGKACNSSNAATVCTLPNSNCTQTSSTCACNTGFMNKNDQCLAELGGPCAKLTDCSAVNNSICDKTSHKCACAATHKEVSSGQCKAKGLGDLCQDDTDCVAVKSSVCNKTTSRKCECPKTHKEDGGQCKIRVIGKACTTTSEATVCTLENSSCNKTLCACKTGFHNQNDQCLSDHQDSSADSQRLAFSIFASSLMLTIRKMFLR